MADAVFNPPDLGNICATSFAGGSLCSAGIPGLSLDDPIFEEVERVEPDDNISPAEAERIRDELLELDLAGVRREVRLAEERAIEADARARGARDLRFRILGAGASPQSNTAVQAAGALLLVYERNQRKWARTNRARAAIGQSILDTAVFRREP